LDNEALASGPFWARLLFLLRATAGFWVGDPPFALLMGEEPLATAERVAAKPARLAISERRHAAGSLITDQRSRLSTADLAALWTMFAVVSAKIPLLGGRARTPHPAVLYRSPVPHPARGYKSCSDNFSALSRSIAAEIVNPPPSSFPAMETMRRRGGYRSCSENFFDCCRML